MSNPNTLVPAYGRDYKSKKAAEESFKNGEDWIIADISNRWDSKPCSIRDMKPGEVKLRYKKLTMLCVVKITEADIEAGDGCNNS